jgi:acyl-CoA synthetase (NDP forming)
LIADAAHGTAVRFAPLTSSQTTTLRQTLGPLVALSNPLDYHTFIWGNEDAMAATFAAMMTPDVALGVVVLDFPRPDRCTSPDWDLVLEAVGRAQVATGKPIAVLSSLVENMPETVAHDLVARGILPLCGVTEAIDAIAVAATIGKFGQAPAQVHLSPNILASVLLTEGAAKSLLQAHGVVVPKFVQVQAIAELPKAAQAVGYPVVLKGEGVAHKTEAGAVVVGIGDEKALRDAAQNMPAQSFLLEQMVTNASVELLVGVMFDSAHGYVLTVAAGGTLTEILSDRVNLTLPVDAAHVRGALDKLRIAPLLNGYRGSAPVNQDAIIDTVLAVQSYVMATTPFEVEINPLLCGPDGAIAVDALITTGESHD